MEPGIASLNDEERLDREFFTFRGSDKMPFDSLPIHGLGPEPKRSLQELREWLVQLTTDNRAIEVERGNQGKAKWRQQLDAVGFDTELFNYQLTPPLVFEVCPIEATPRPLLILENYSTYHSFTRWNRQAKLFEAIVYGQGDSFETAAAGLHEVTQSLNWDKRSFYFGDVDVKGVLIPIFASATLQSIGLPRLIPHRGCYHRLFKRASVARLPSGVPTTLPSECQQWLGESLAQEAASWLDRGIRLPQELVGWDELLQNGNIFAQPEISYDEK